MPEKFITEGYFDEWVRNLGRQINQLRIDLQQFISSSSPTFVALPDTPNSYDGQGRRLVVVSAVQDGLSFGGSFLMDIEEAAVSNPPTEAEMDALFGEVPDTFVHLVQDTDGPLWLVVMSGGTWRAFEAINLS